MFQKVVLGECASMHWHMVHTHTCVYIYNYIHTYIRTYIHPSIHTYIHLQFHTYIDIDVHYIHSIIITYVCRSCPLLISRTDGDLGLLSCTGVRSTLRC